MVGSVFQRHAGLDCERGTHLADLRNGAIHTAAQFGDGYRGEFFEHGAIMPKGCGRSELPMANLRKREDCPPGSFLRTACRNGINKASVQVGARRAPTQNRRVTLTISRHVEWVVAFLKTRPDGEQTRIVFAFGT